jgi:hypothetical protein
MLASDDAKSYWYHESEDCCSEMLGLLALLTACKHDSRCPFRTTKEKHMEKSRARKLRVSTRRVVGILMAMRSRSPAKAELARALRCTPAIPRSGSVHMPVQSRTMLALTSGRRWNLAFLEGSPSAVAHMSGGAPRDRLRWNSEFVATLERLIEPTAAGLNWARLIPPALSTEGEPNDVGRHVADESGVGEIDANPAEHGDASS